MIERTRRYAAKCDRGRGCVLCILFPTYRRSSKKVPVYSAGRTWGRGADTLNHACKNIRISESESRIGVPAVPDFGHVRQNASARGRIRARFSGRVRIQNQEFAVVRIMSTRESRTRSGQNSKRVSRRMQNPELCLPRPLS